MFLYDTILLKLLLKSFLRGILWQLELIFVVYVEILLNSGVICVSVDADDIF